MSQLSNEQRRKNVAEELWLHYFNDSLLTKGVITEKEHLKMNLEINLRTQRLLKGRKETKNGKNIIHR